MNFLLKKQKINLWKKKKRFLIRNNCHIFFIIFLQKEIVRMKTKIHFWSKNKNNFLKRLKNERKKEKLGFFVLFPEEKQNVLRPELGKLWIHQWELRYIDVSSFYDMCEEEREKWKRKKRKRKEEDVNRKFFQKLKSRRKRNSLKAKMSKRFLVFAFYDR